LGRNVSRQRAQWNYDVPGAPVRVKPERERVIFPLEVCEYRSYTAEYEHYRGIREDRSFAPYQPGEVLFVRNGNLIQIARVLRVFAHHMESKRNGDRYIPRYNIQTVTKDLFWSANYRSVFPGDIFYAYHERGPGEKSVFRPPFILKEFIAELK